MDAIRQEGDTIFAVASGNGRAAIAVIRLSGPGCARVLDALCRRRPAERAATVRTLRDAAGRPLDQALVLWMPGPGTFTGEDCLELHVHGGRAVMQDVASALVELGVRPAEPGEFTRRAFLNGRMDLLEAEALADLIEAETTAQREQAVRQLEGALGSLIRSWTNTITLLLAQQEALIDFPDEDLPADVETELLQAAEKLLGEMHRHLQDGRRGELLREGVTVVIAGAPNAGKSTLINELTGRDVAIVTDRPGTTRDVLEARMELAGTLVTLVDTAGLRESTDPVEAEGVRRARHRAETADLLLLVSAPDAAAPADLPHHPLALRIAAKADIGVSVLAPDITVSAQTGQGMDELRAALAERVQELTRNEGPPPLTRARHRAALLEAAETLARALAAPMPEMRGEDFRLALRALGRITGRVGVEDILDSVFRQFCIGK